MTDTGVLQRFQRRSHNHALCVSRALTSADAQCRARGLRLTPLRRRVLELIWDSHKPSKAYDLLQHLVAAGHRAAPPTIYRALGFLLDVGLIHRIASLNAYIGCGDPARGHSGQFLICERCGTTAELDDPKVSTHIVASASELGFMVTHEIVEIAGLCQTCQ